MRYLPLQECKPSEPVALTVQQRDQLRTLVPDLRLEVAAGVSDAYVLTPGSNVGVVALEGLAIEIRPKLAIERVLFLVSYSLGLAKWGDAPFGLTADDSLIETMVRVFEHHLGRALRRGVLQGYRTEEDALMAVRGRIRFDEQVRRRFGFSLPVEVRFDEFTEDILENRLLKSALTALGRLRLRSDSSRQSLRRFNHILQLVSDPSYDPHNVPAVIYTPLNEHYREAVEWARLILRFASVETRHGKVVGTTVLFDMNAVFEQFVRTALREKLELTVREFPAGAECPRLYLDAQHRIPLEPDLSWWAGKRCRFVGDVKYKRVNVQGVKHPDLYQLLAYVTATNLPAGLLIYAAGEEERATHVVEQAGKTLHVRALELSGSIQAIQAELGTVATEVRSLVQSSSVAA